MGCISFAPKNTWGPRGVVIGSVHFPGIEERRFDCRRCAAATGARLDEGWFPRLAVCAYQRASRTQRRTVLSARVAPFACI